LKSNLKNSLTVADFKSTVFFNLYETGNYLFEVFQHIYSKSASFFKRLFQSFRDCFNSFWTRSSELRRFQLIFLTKSIV
jgi:hypothetical protein